MLEWSGLAIGVWPALEMRLMSCLQHIPDSTSRQLHAADLRRLPLWPCSMLHIYICSAAQLTCGVGEVLGPGKVIAAQGLEALQVA